MCQPVNLLTERLKRRPPHTQDEMFAMAARYAIAAYGPFRGEDEIKEAAAGIVVGIFEDNLETAPEWQQQKWLEMAEDAYRAAIKDH